MYPTILGGISTLRAPWTTPSITSISSHTTRHSQLPITISRPKPSNEQKVHRRSRDLLEPHLSPHYPNTELQPAQECMDDLQESRVTLHPINASKQQLAIANSIHPEPRSPTTLAHSRPRTMRPNTVANTYEKAVLESRVLTYSRTHIFPTHHSRASNTSRRAEHEKVLDASFAIRDSRPA
ncbi:hypothetical protein BofuT4_P046090.1 [Botrytis cinerea T4]|uniref:Uncharacterized protein n=1 Tax=Botryotinia fuckeliana (strain T4) TaxID=999810 RepID=G2XYQ4_BOTF4|nr:hypothetical protein BofuT4_P046090.1 [Botrytis cinerea T4]